MTGRRTLTAVLAVLLVLALVELVAGALMSGVTIDEPVHLLRARGWLDYGWFSPAIYLVNGEPPAVSTVGPSVTSPYVYGPAFAAVAHSANVIAGSESTNSITDTARAWKVRHLVSALIGGVTAGVAGIAVRSLTGSFRFGLWTAVCLLAIPLWSGMSFFNPKDLPAAAGYTLVTAGLITALQSMPAGSRARYLRLAGIAALLAAGIYLGAGTRLAFWLPILASLITYGAIAGAGSRYGQKPRDYRGFLAVLTGCTIGAVLLLATYPVLLEAPVDFLTHSLRDSSQFPWHGETLTAGQLLPGDAPVWYLPAWSFATIPLLVGLLALTGLALALRDWTRAGRDGANGRLGSILDRDDLPLLLVIQQVLLVSLGSIVLGSSMYSGLRQHLYMVPAIAMLAGFGAFRAWHRFGTGARSSSRSRYLVSALLSLALLVPMAEGALLFPHNYTYVNPVAGIKGINGNWETDYWWSSLRESLEQVPDGVAPVCSTNLARPGDRDGDIAVFPCSDHFGDPESGDPGPADPRDGSVWVLGRNRADSAVPDYCTVEDRISRWVRGEDVLMSYVLRCDPERVPVKPSP